MFDVSNGSPLTVGKKAPPLSDASSTLRARSSWTAPAERSGDGALEDAADSKAVSTPRSATAVHEDSRFERSLAFCHFFFEALSSLVVPYNAPSRDPSIGTQSARPAKRLRKFCRILLILSKPPLLLAQG